MSGVPSHPVDPMTHRYTLLKLLTALAVLLPGVTAQAQGQSARLITQDVVADIRAWAVQPVTIIPITAQNALHADLTQGEIEALDERWRAEREAEDQPLIAQLLATPLSTYLNQIQAQSLGLYPEIFVMDNRGLNVGQSSVTSDYWQGDEGKFQNTYPVGSDAVFIDEAEYHEDSDTYRAQVSLTLADPATGDAVGAITVEVNLTELARRQNVLY